MGPRVLKFDWPLARGLWYRRFAAISIYARLRRENHKTAPSCGREYSLSTLWPAPLSEAMHSEHDLKERQRRTNHSESFPLWGHNPSIQPAAEPCPLSGSGIQVSTANVTKSP